MSHGLQKLDTIVEIKVFSKLKLATNMTNESHSYNLIDPPDIYTHPRVLF
jgi:hypothetical protein